MTQYEVRAARKAFYSVRVISTGKAPLTVLGIRLDLWEVQELTTRTFSSKLKVVQNHNYKFIFTIIIQ